MNDNSRLLAPKHLFWSWFRLKLGAKITLSIGLVVGLTILVIFAFIYYLQQRQVMGRLETEAKSLLTSMVLVREWVANYGGVWTSDPGDIYLEEHNGFYRKTPAMVTKELSALSDSKNFYRFHITSLKLKNPDNAPLASEEWMLQKFIEGHQSFGQIEQLDGKRVYHYMIPLMTKEACLDCHQDQGYQVGDLRGGLSVFLPMADVDHVLAQNRWILMVAATIILFLSIASLYWLVRRLIVMPIEQLETVTKAVGQGNYHIQCNLNTGDELESLGNVINQMVANLKASRDALETKIKQRTNEFATLSKIAITINRNETLQETLNQALNIIINVTPATSGAIHLRQIDGQDLDMVAWHGLPDILEKCMAHLKPEQCIPSRVMQSGNSICQIEVPHCDQNGLCGYKCPLGNTTWDLISAPLKSKSRILGAITLITPQPAAFSEEITQLLECVGHQLGVGIENAYFHKQARQMAILEERGRLARELHDNVAQTISYLNLNTRIIADMVKAGQWTKAQRALEEMETLTNTAYDDLRWAIFDLRAPIDGEQDLQHLLQNYIDEFEIQSGLTCYFNMTGETHLPPDVTVHLTRIVQEAMHNVRKHARAKQIWIKFENNEHGLQLSIEDDGIGINQSNSKPATHHFGLRSMRERAEAIGWQLNIGPRAQGGTRVIAWKNGQHSSNPVRNPNNKEVTNEQTITTPRTYQNFSSG